MLKAVVAAVIVKQVHRAIPGLIVRTSRGEPTGATDAEGVELTFRDPAHRRSPVTPGTPQRAPALRLGGAGDRRAITAGGDTVDLPGARESWSSSRAG